MSELLRFSSESLVDIENLHAHIAQHQIPARAYKIASRIRVAINRLTTFPEMGRLGRVQGTRELIIGGLPYLAVYELQDDRVIILRVLHTSQHWPPEEVGDAVE